MNRYRFSGSRIVIFILPLIFFPLLGFSGAAALDNPDIPIMLSAILVMFIFAGFALVLELKSMSLLAHGTLRSPKYYIKVLTVLTMVCGYFSFDSALQAYNLFLTGDLFALNIIRAAVIEGDISRSFSGRVAGLFYIPMLLVGSFCAERFSFKEVRLLVFLAFVVAVVYSISTAGRNHIILFFIAYLPVIAMKNGIIRAVVFFTVALTLLAVMQALRENGTTLSGFMSILDYVKLPWIGMECYFDNCNGKFNFGGFDPVSEIILENTPFSYKGFYANIFGGLAQGHFLFGNFVFVWNVILIVMVYFLIALPGDRGFTGFVISRWFFIYIFYYSIHDLVLFYSSFSVTPLFVILLKVLSICLKKFSRNYSKNDIGTC